MSGPYEQNPCGARMELHDELPRDMRDMLQHVNISIYLVRRLILTYGIGAARARIKAEYDYTVHLH